MSLAIVISAGGNYASILIAEKRLIPELTEKLRFGIEASLTEALFERDGRRDQDTGGIGNYIKQTNGLLNKFEHRQGFWPMRLTDIHIARIGNVGSPKFVDVQPFTRMHSIEITLSRAGKDRAIELKLFSQPNPIWSLSWFIFVAIAIGITSFAFPKPFRPNQYLIYQRLIQLDAPKGTAEKLARAVVDGFEFSEEQWDLIDHLQSTDHDWNNALAAAKSAQQVLVNSSRKPWLQLGLRLGLGPEKAIALAEKDDSIDIDITRNEIRLRGLPLQMTRAPLVYYIWYLEKRLGDDGWVTNPRAGKVDPELGNEIEELFDELGGDKRSTDALTREGGVTEKMLRSMRSKITLAITSLVGPTLASPYLFEDQPSVKNPGAKDQRVSLHPSQITIVARFTRG